MQCSKSKALLNLTKHKGHKRKRWMLTSSKAFMHIKYLPMGFSGVSGFLAPPKTCTDDSKLPLKAGLYMTYDFAFHVQKQGHVGPEDEI